MARRRAFGVLDTNRIVRPSSSTTPRPPARTPSDRSSDKHHPNTKKSAQKRKSHAVSPLWNTETKTPRTSNCGEKASNPRSHPRKHHLRTLPTTPRTHPKNNRNDKNLDFSVEQSTNNRPREPFSSATAAAKTTLAEPKQGEPHAKVQADNGAMEVETPEALSEISGFEDSSTSESPPSKAVSFQESSLNRIKAAARMTPVTKKRKKSKIGASNTLSTPAAKSRKNSTSEGQGRVEPQAISTQKTQAEAKAQESGRRFVHFERPPQPEMFSKAAIQELQKHASSPDDREIFEAVNDGPRRTSKSVGPMMGRTVGGRRMQRVDSLEEEELTVDSNIQPNDSPPYSNDPRHVYQRHPQPERLTKTSGRERTLGAKIAKSSALDGQVDQNNILDSFLVQTMFYPESDTSEEASPVKAEETEHDGIKNPSPNNHSQGMVCLPEVWSLPDDETSVNSKNFIFEIKGKKYLHPALPPGWVFRISKSQGIPFYEHPDHGFTYYCPVTLPVKPSAANSAYAHNNQNNASRAREITQPQNNSGQLPSSTSLGFPQVTYSPYHRQHYSVSQALHLHPLEDKYFLPQMPEQLGFPRVNRPLSSQNYIPAFEHQYEEDTTSSTLEVPRGLQLPRAGHRLYQSKVLASEQSQLDRRISPRLSDEISRFQHMSHLIDTQQKEAFDFGIIQHPLETGPSQLATMDSANLHFPHPSQGLQWQARQSNVEISPLMSPAVASTPPPGLKIVPSSFHVDGKKDSGETNHAGKIDFTDDRCQAYAKALLSDKVIGSYGGEATSGDDMELCSQPSEELFSLGSSAQAQSDTGSNAAVVETTAEDMITEEQTKVDLTSSSKERHTLSLHNGEEVVTVKGQHRCGNKIALYCREDTTTLAEDSGAGEVGSCSRTPQPSCDFGDNGGDDDMELSEDDQNGEEPASSTKRGEDSSMEDCKTSPENLLSEKEIHPREPTKPKHGEDSCKGDCQTNSDSLSSGKKVDNGEAASSPKTGADFDLKDCHVSPGSVSTKQEVPERNSHTRGSAAKECTGTPLYNSETEVTQAQTPSTSGSTTLSMSSATHRSASSLPMSNDSKPSQDTDAPDSVSAPQGTSEEKNNGTFQNTPAGSHLCPSATSNSQENEEAPEVTTVTVLSHARSRKKGSSESTQSFNQGAEDEISPGPRVVNLDEASFAQKDDEELSDLGSPVDDAQTDKDKKPNTRKSISSSESLVGCTLSPIGNEESPGSPKMMSSWTPHRLCSLQNTTSLKKTGMYAVLYRFTAVRRPYAFQEKIAPRKKR